jgi:hypothetical protein
MSYYQGVSVFVKHRAHILFAGCDGDVAQAVITWISDLAKFGH